MYAIKALSAAGYKVVTTASPKNFDLVKKLGASAVFDYKDPEGPAKIKAWAKENGGDIKAALNSISEPPETFNLIEAAIADKDATILSLSTSVSCSRNAV